MPTPPRDGASQGDKPLTVPWAWRKASAPGSRFAVSPGSAFGGRDRSTVPVEILVTEQWPPKTRSGAGALVEFVGRGQGRSTAGERERVGFHAASGRGGRADPRSGATFDRSRGHAGSCKCLILQGKSRFFSASTVLCAVLRSLVRVVTGADRRSLVSLDLSLVRPRLAWFFEASFGRVL